MILLSLAILALLFAALPAAMVLANLPVFRQLPPMPRGQAQPKVSILIPARNEADKIERTARAVLTSQNVDLELLIMDDHSADATPRIVTALAEQDPRVQLLSAPPLPEGWCGKQHACWHLATHAKHDTLIWIDADVLLAPDGIARIAAHLDRSRLGLLSGFPRQITASWLEKLIVPMIELLILCYFPIRLSRRDRRPSLATGCGQLMAANRHAYFTVAGHSAIRHSLHDGVTLPPVFRQGGFATDIFDASDIACCRMYRGAKQTWRGFGKNATEGLASPRGIVIWTSLLAGAFVLPWVALVLASFWTHRLAAMTISAAAVALALVTSLIVMKRAQQPWLAGLARPVGVLLLLVIQWQALFRRLRGQKPQWLGRSYPAS